MKIFLRYCILIITLLSVINANSLDNKAFNEYRKNHYTKALKLYLKSAQDNDLKAILMIALFYEKGLGVKRDSSRAIKLYKLILKRTKNIKKLIKNGDYKRVYISIEALKRLYIITGDREYFIIMKRLKKLYNIELNSQVIQIDSNRDDYLILCPDAQVIALEDREGIEQFDCSLFGLFPKKMAKFMHLRHLRFNLLNSDSKKRVAILKKINKEINILIKPMIKHLEKNVIQCYVNAKSMDDIYSCDYDYLLKSDPMFFTNRAYKFEQYIVGHKLKNYKLTNRQKSILITKLKEQIANNSYGKNWKSMVK